MSGLQIRSRAPLNRAVVAMLDGRRLRGFVYDFSPEKDSFHLLPRWDSPREDSHLVLLGKVKAVFFVREFAGNPARQSKSPEKFDGVGRRVEVVFEDGERIQGITSTYSRERRGFFVFPADGGSNNLRIFVVQSNAKDVKFL